MKWSEKKNPVYETDSYMMVNLSAVIQSTIGVSIVLALGERAPGPLVITIPIATAVPILAILVLVPVIPNHISVSVITIPFSIILPWAKAPTPDRGPAPPSVTVVPPWAPGPRSTVPPGWRRASVIAPNRRRRIFGPLAKDT